MSNSNIQLVPRQPVQSERETVRDFKKRHRSPSTLFASERTAILGELRAGRNIAQTARAYSADPHVCTELWFRSLEQRLTEMSRYLYGVGRIA